MGLAYWGQVKAVGSPKPFGGILVVVVWGIHGRKSRWYSCSGGGDSGSGIEGERSLLKSITETTEYRIVAQ
jgi:hypothetical protein